MYVKGTVTSAVTPVQVLVNLGTSNVIPATSELCFLHHLFLPRQMCRYPQSTGFPGFGESSVGPSVVAVSLTPIRLSPKRLVSMAVDGVWLLSKDGGNVSNGEGGAASYPVCVYG